MSVQKNNVPPTDGAPCCIIKSTEYEINKCKVIRHQVHVQRFCTNKCDQICCPGNMYLFQLIFYIRKLFGKNSQIKNTSQKKNMVINLSTLCVVLRTVQYIVLLPH